MILQLCCSGTTSHLRITWYLIWLVQVLTTLNHLSANATKWSNTHKQFVGFCRQIMSVFDHFVRLALKTLTKLTSFIFSCSAYYMLSLLAKYRLQFNKHCPYRHFVCTDREIDISNFTEMIPIRRHIQIKMFLNWNLRYFFSLHLTPKAPNLKSRLSNQYSHT